VVPDEQIAELTCCEKRAWAVSPRQRNAAGSVAFTNAGSQVTIDIFIFVGFHP
jgi:hypothetical protein